MLVILLVLALTVLLFASAYSSYLSAIIYRLPRGENPFGIIPVGKKPACSNCDTELKWYEYYPIPFLLFMRRHCRWCKAPVPRIFLVSDITFIVIFIINFALYVPSEGLETFIVELTYCSLLFIIIFIWAQRLTIPSSLIIFTVMGALSARLWKGEGLIEALMPIGMRALVILLIIKTISEYAPRKLKGTSLNTIASIYAITCWVELIPAIAMAVILKFIKKPSPKI